MSFRKFLSEGRVSTSVNVNRKSTKRMLSLAKSDVNKTNRPINLFLTCQNLKRLM